MAGLVINVLRGAGQALLRGGATNGGRAVVGAGGQAAGNGAADHAAGAAAAAAAAANGQRAEDADNAGTRPLSDGATQSETNDGQCEKCPPDCGTLVTRRYSMSEISRSYQASITEMPPFQEWSFLGIDFDGFRSSSCTLLEAKARYDQFFDPTTGTPKWFFRRFGSIRLIEQARKQSRTILSSPPANLHWHFMQPISQAYFTMEFLGNGFPIKTFLTP